MAIQLAGCSYIDRYPSHLQVHQVSEITVGTDIKLWLHKATVQCTTYISRNHTKNERITPPEKKTPHLFFEWLFSEKWIRFLSDLFTQEIITYFIGGQIILDPKIYGHFEDFPRSIVLLLWIGVL